MKFLECFSMTKNEWREIAWYTIWGMAISAVLRVDFIEIGFWRWMIGWFIVVAILPKKPWLR